MNQLIKDFNNKTQHFKAHSKTFLVLSVLFITLFLIQFASTAPQITFNYPVGTLDYGVVNGKLQLNFTATDTNLDSVWYEYIYKQENNYTNSTERTNSDSTYQLIKTFNFTAFPIFITKGISEAKGTAIINRGNVKYNFVYEDGTSSEVESPNIEQTYTNYTFNNPNLNKRVDYIEIYLKRSSLASGTAYERNTIIDTTKGMLNYNSSMAGAVSGVYNLSNITLSTKKNVTIYANDTAGNLNTTTFSWDYTIFENSRTYSSNALTGSTETFSINITGTTTDYYLVYNGTPYLSTKSGNVYTNTIEVPSSAGTYSFYWSFNGKTINTSTSSQVVTQLAIDNCSSYTYKLYNFTLVDEKLQTALTANSSIETYLLIKSKTGNQISNLSNKVTGVSTTAICLNTNLTNSSADYLLDAIIKYESQDHEIEYYNILNQSLSNSTILSNITLYDLATAESTDFKVTLKDSNYATVSNALISVQRQYVSENGIFKAVEIAKTDSNGQTVIHLVTADAVYNIIAYDSSNGNVIAYLNNVVATCEDPTTYNCNVYLNELSSIEELFNYQDTFKIAYTNPTYNNVSLAISTTFYTYDGTPKEVLMVVKKYDMVGNTTLCNSSITSASSTLSCTIPSAYQDSDFEINLYVEGELLFYEYIKSNQRLFGGFGFYLILLLVLTLSMMFVDSKTGIVISPIIALIFGSVVGVTKGAILGVASGIMWLIVVAMILLYKLNKENDS